MYTYESSNQRWEKRVILTIAFQCNELGPMIAGKMKGREKFEWGE